MLKAILAAGICVASLMVPASVQARKMTLMCVANATAMQDFSELAKHMPLVNALRNGADYFLGGVMPMPDALVVDTEAQMINGVPWKQQGVVEEIVGFRYVHRWWSLDRRTLALTVSHLDDSPFDGGGWVIGSCPIQQPRTF